MDKAQLLNKLKIKTLIVGSAGAGKTYTCVKCAEAVANNNKKVLYLDVDDGAVLELVNLEDSTLKNITHQNITSYKQLVSELNKATNYDLIIIDMLYPHLQDWCRLEAKEAFLKQGYYKIGEKVVRIENPETFDLSGFMYQIPNNWEKALFKLLRKIPCNIIATAYPINEDAKRNMIYGFFDIVMQIYNTTEGRVANPIKIRADPKLEKEIKTDYISALINKIQNK